MLVLVQKSNEGGGQRMALSIFQQLLLLYTTLNRCTDILNPTIYISLGGA